MTARVEREDGSPVCERCTVAASSRARLRGLLGRRGLRAGEGLLLRPCASVHTCFLPFALDVVLLDEDDRVVHVVEHLRPWRLAGRRGTRSVLELAAGEAVRRSVMAGERLTVVLRDPAP
ncbi:MAG: DUF192 domain-containing protein [Actinomycetota bacterium]|nr:DUF192 domain-containing protein [Actinomycetota bacterium]